MNRETKHNWWVWAACLILTLLKLWVTAGQTLSAIGTPYDDFHYLTQAQYLLHGQWMGPYNAPTLIKGPFFPAWIAFAFLARIPLLTSVQFLYALACGLLTVAVKPLLRRGVHLPILYGLLLFNPESNAASLTRVLREMITPALTVLVAACALGLLLRRGTERKSWLWAVGLGSSFAALCLTREEELVVVPFLVFGAAAAAWFAWKRAGGAGLLNGLAPWLIAAAVWAAIVYAVAAENYVRYGIFAKTEFDAPSYQAAYGALARVKPVEFKPYVPVTKETRQRIAKVSPAFREIDPFIEGIPGAYWEAFSEYQQDDSNRHEILGGWFGWALRDAINSAGYYSNGTYPDAYYRRLAHEVNAACDQRLLDCYSPRSTLMPVWHNSYALDWIPSFGDKLAEVVGFRAIGLDAAPGIGTPEQLALFRELTGDQITPSRSADAGVQAFSASLQRGLLGFILRLYQLFDPVLAVIALIVYAVFTIDLLRRRLAEPTWVALTGLLVLSLARIAAIAYMNVSAFKVPPGAYLTESYPAMLAFVGLGCLEAVGRLEGLLRSRN